MFFRLTREQRKEAAGLGVLITAVIWMFAMVYFFGPQHSLQIPEENEPLFLYALQILK
ncbi:hypothetical protein B0H94_101216 [Salsuginibacillus halophilus]|uniref:Uncharacterized protein n=1 Tax=Salsuginibacillus halophilus TaxID=517424 RepID=A0A2P8HYL5_9BACI|nr:hypothetical protein [Salsuginibacillus halophilus]PSL51303.1 hypothetical protein B0H94_101216 [Salsuginibacillus halophilus]